MRTCMCASWIGGRGERVIVGCTTGAKMRSFTGYEVFVAEFSCVGGVGSVGSVVGAIFGLRPRRFYQ